MLEDKEVLKGTSLGAQSGGEQTTGGEENDTKGDTTGMGPFLDTPPFWNPPYLKIEWQGGSGIESRP